MGSWDPRRRRGPRRHVSHLSLSGEGGRSVTQFGVPPLQGRTPVPPLPLVFLDLPLGSEVGAGVESLGPGSPLVVWDHKYYLKGVGNYRTFCIIVRLSKRFSFTRLQATLPRRWLNEFSFGKKTGSTGEFPTVTSSCSPRSRLRVPRSTRSWISALSTRPVLHRGPELGRRFCLSRKLVPTFTRGSPTRT